MRFLNWLPGIAEIVLTIITGIYAFFTYGMLKESRSEHESLFRPYISISPVVYPGNPIIYLGIKNTGKTSAKRLKLTLDRDFYQFGKKDEGHNIKNFSIFREGADSFAPEEEIVFALALGYNILGQHADPNIVPSRFNITAEYEYYWERGKKVREDAVIDLKPYFNSQIPPDPLKRIVDELEKIKCLLERGSK